MTVSEFLKAYMTNSLGKKTTEGNWKVINWGHMDTLQYWPSDKKGKYENVAYRLPSGEVLLNANRLKYVGRIFAWGRECQYSTGNNQTKIQRYLEQLGAISLPFTLFDETGLDVRDFEWIQKPVGETIIVKEEKHYQQFVGVPRHFPGACVFKIGEKYHLFDVDRKELEENKIFNAFIVEVPEPVSNVTEAYEALMPREVSDAIDSGIDVKRQGEFFFVKVGDECPLKMDVSPEDLQILRFPPSRYGFGIPYGNGNAEFVRNRGSGVPDYAWTRDDRDPIGGEEGTELNLTPLEEEFQKAAKFYKEARKRYDETVMRRGTLDTGVSSSHSVERYVKDGDNTYVNGTVKQSRREHGDLTLHGWYKAIPNRAVKSFTIRGEID